MSRSQSKSAAGWLETTTPCRRRAHYKLGGIIIPQSITPLERFEVYLMDFEIGGSGEVPDPTRPEQWVPWKPRVPPEVAYNYETGCWLLQERVRRGEE